jgi:hypothetical protein
MATCLSGGEGLIELRGDIADERTQREGEDSMEPPPPRCFTSCFTSGRCRLQQISSQIRSLKSRGSSATLPKRVKWAWPMSLAACW